MCRGAQRRGGHPAGPARRDFQPDEGATGAAGTGKTTAKPDVAQIQLQIDDQTAQGVYVNMAMVNHNETEFVVDFIYVQPQAPKAVVRARIINSPKHMKRLLHALQDNVSKYEAQFGRIDLSGSVPPTLGMPQ